MNHDVSLCVCWMVWWRTRTPDIFVCLCQLSTDELGARGWKGYAFVFSRCLFPAPFICWCLTSFINRPTTLKTKGDIAILKSSKRSIRATLRRVNQLQEPRCDISHTRIKHLSQRTLLSRKVRVQIRYTIIIIITYQMYAFEMHKSCFWAGVIKCRCLFCFKYRVWLWVCVYLCIYIWNQIIQTLTMWFIHAKIT